MNVDRIHFISPKDPAKHLAALDKQCFGSEAMTFKEWLQVTSSPVIIVCAWEDPDKDHFSGLSVARYAAGIGYLYSSAVVPEARRLGIGERMVRKRIELLEDLGCAVIQAHTRIENEPSQNMLRKCGFLPIQYVTDFYDDFEDAILWERAR
jgi:ribosomal protein S18 acetylase RimI-like enzyme